MTAKICKRCPKFKIGSSFCTEHNKQVSQWNDWCYERVSQYENWQLTTKEN